MKTYRLHLIYLFCAIITFGDMTTQPYFQQLVDKADEDKHHIDPVPLLLACAVWPLWWSGRFFKWIKS